MFSPALVSPAVRFPQDPPSACSKPRSGPSGLAERKTRRSRAGSCRAVKLGRGLTGQGVGQQASLLPGQRSHSALGHGTAGQICQQGCVWQGSFWLFWVFLDQTLVPSFHFLLILFQNAPPTHTPTHTIGFLSLIIFARRDRIDGAVKAAAQPSLVQRHYPSSR